MKATSNLMVIKMKMKINKTHMVKMMIEERMRILMMMMILKREETKMMN